MRQKAIRVGSVLSAIRDCPCASVLAPLKGKGAATGRAYRCSGATLATPSRYTCLYLRAKPSYLSSCAILRIPPTIRLPKDAPMAITILAKHRFSVRCISKFRYSLTTGTQPASRSSVKKAMCRRREAHITGPEDLGRSRRRVK